MKKVISIVLSIVIFCLTVLLCVNFSIKTMSTKTVTNAIVVQEASSGIEEVINEAFPEVSNEDIAKVQSVIEENKALNNVSSDFISQITDAVTNGSNVDTAAIAAQLATALDDNISEIESALGKEIPQEKVAEIQSKITDEGGTLQNKINDTVKKLETATPGTKQFIKTYKTLSDMPTRIICIVGIVLSILVIALLNRSYYKWTIYAGITTIISAAIIGLFLPMIVNAMEFTIGTRILGMSIDIPVGALRFDGVICGVIGVVLLVVYFIFKRNDRSYQRNYY